MSDNAKETSEGVIGSLIGSRTLQRETKQVLDQIEGGGEPVLIMRHGRPVAALVAIDEERAKALVLADSLTQHGVGAASKKHRESEPFAVSEREIGEEQEATTVAGEQESVVDTTRRFRSAVEALEAEIGRVREDAESNQALGSEQIDALLLESGQILGEFVERFSQAEVNAQTIREAAGHD